MEHLSQLELKNIFKQELEKEQNIIEYEETVLIKIHSVIKEIKKRVEQNAKEMLIY